MDLPYSNAGKTASTVESLGVEILLLMDRWPESVKEKHISYNKTVIVLLIMIMIRMKGGNTKQTTYCGGLSNQGGPLWSSSLIQKGKNSEITIIYWIMT